MTLINILNEKMFFKKAQLESLFKPSGFSILFIIEGIIELEINGEPVVFEKEHLVLISPHNIYKLKYYNESLRMCILIHDRKAIREMINFDFNRYDVYQTIYAEKNHNVFKPGKEAFEQMLQQVNLLDYYNKKSDTTFWQNKIITNVYLSIIYILIDSLIEYFRDEDQITSRKEEITIQFIDSVYLNFKSNKNLKFYADQQNISIKYLSICVKETTGSSPTTFISNALVNDAKTLLLSTDKMVSTISDELGFSDQYSFGKFFKKHTQLSPRYYRKKNFLIDTI